MSQRRSSRSQNDVPSVEHLVSVIQELSRIRDMRTLHTVVCTAAHKLAGTDSAHIYLHTGGQEGARVEAGGRPPVDICIGKWVVQHRRPVLVSDIADDLRIPAEGRNSHGAKSMLMVPIRRSNPIGAIGSYWGQVYRPSEFELNMLQALADSTAMAIESVRILTDVDERVRQRTQQLEAANEEIRQLSLVDELTGLNNRRGFFMMAEQARNAALRQGARVFILFIDADGLKKVNDTLGHEAGDEMLRNLAQVLKATFRRSDILARLGGDEFCVFGSHDNGDPAAAKDRLYDRIEQFNAGHTGPYRLAASIGISSFAANDQQALEDVVAIADRAMYDEKRARRAQRVD
jgi:diguanylate cyclase (GGDEF)-like protein